ncbi:MAG TPA: ABC transporter ATP-binding protein [Bacteroidales bacterium]|nr:ABC transporter ATP-binding protein [Bacteroidales bacterium]HPS17482.1 ABC transporter ATP-binding protein [Bacteroidales bacterium]
MIEIKNISKSFQNFNLKNISFSVEKGDYFVLLGASGMGKSMLLEIISGITNPDSGEILLNGNNITFEKIQKRKTALVYQDQVLFPHLTVFENIAFSLRCKKKSSNEIRNTVNELADLVEIKNFLQRKPGTLSGGEAQRVALARALATKPECLLLDEPLSNIDSSLRYELRSLLRKINNNGQTIIHVTHDYEEAISLANRLAVIEHGNIVQIGSPEEVFMFPKSEFIAKFIGVKNFYKGNLISNENNSDLKSFETNNIKIYVTTENTSGEGFLLIPSESIVISNVQTESSSRNIFKGTVIDFFPARTGIEVVVNIGEIKITSIISKDSFEKLELIKGKEVWTSFKASCAKFISI